MLEINVPPAAWSTNRVILGDKFYVLTFKYNDVDERWRFDLHYENTPVILGVKCMEDQDLLGRYILDNFDHGTIMCIRKEDDGLLCGRDNLGFNLPYGLFYFSNSELS